MVEARLIDTYAPSSDASHFLASNENTGIDAPRIVTSLVPLTLVR
jgi:hypothetical protein